MPVTVVPTSFATVAIETFITELSSVSRTICVPERAALPSPVIPRQYPGRGVVGLGSPSVALRQPSLGQLLQGSAASRAPRHPLRAADDGRRRTLEPARGARRAQPVVARDVLVEGGGGLVARLLLFRPSGW